MVRGTIHAVDYEQWLPCSPAELFAFFSDPANLARLSPPFVGFRLLATSMPALAAGTRLDYRLSLHGIPIRWQSAITLWEPPRRFVDVQTRGPYRTWEHTHDFEPSGNGTLVRDRVRYAIPFGALGELVAGRWVARDVAAIFAFRRVRLAELFG